MSCRLSLQQSYDKQNRFSHSHTPQVPHTWVCWCWAQNRTNWYNPTIWMYKITPADSHSIFICCVGWSTGSNAFYLLGTVRERRTNFWFTFSFKMLRYLVFAVCVSCALAAVSGLFLRSRSWQTGRRYRLKRKLLVFLSKRALGFCLANFTILQQIFLISIVIFTFLHSFLTSDAIKTCIKNFKYDASEINVYSVSVRSANVFIGRILKTNKKIWPFVGYILIYAGTKSGRLC